MSHFVRTVCISVINPSRPDPRRREKVHVHFYSHISLWCLKKFYEGLVFLCGALKGYMKALKAIKKPFEAPQKSAEIKILVNFYFNTNF